MVTLSRTVRFAVNDPAAERSPGTDANGYAGVPAMLGLARHYELVVACRGEPDAATGYFLDIKAIDHAARLHAIPHIARACQQRPHASPADVLSECLAPLHAALGGTLHTLRWALSPYYSLQMSPHDPHAAFLRQRFEFAAAHRLNVPSLTAEENRRLFGKCNNPAGHGHNYVVEPCVRTPLGPGAMSLPTLETLVRATIIDRFDHTHLNVDVPEFRDGSGLNPSVENIAKVCFDLLAPAVAAKGASLGSVTVWETEKTSCTYPA
jgi:6-pyruvoyltetrahydropterin/6-carboxytetrahydropterin synthase